MHGHSSRPKCPIITLFDKGALASTLSFNGVCTASRPQFGQARANSLVTMSSSEVEEAAQMSGHVVLEHGTADESSSSVIAEGAVEAVEEVDDGSPVPVNDEGDDEGGVGNAALGDDAGEVGDVVNGTPQEKEGLGASEAETVKAGVASKGAAGAARGGAKRTLRPGMSESSFRPAIGAECRVDDRSVAFGRYSNPRGDQTSCQPHSWNQTASFSDWQTVGEQQFQSFHRK